MAINVDKSMFGAVSLFAVLPLLASCGGVSADDTYDSSDDLRSAMESEGFGCEENETESIWNGHGEAMGCTNGYLVVVWDEDLPDDMRDPQDNGDESIAQHLRGQNWDVMYTDGAALDEMQQVFGGERTRQGLPAFSNPTSD